MPRWILSLSGGIWLHSSRIRLAHDVSLASETSGELRSSNLKLPASIVTDL
jgi:hypothetical protein